MNLFYKFHEAIIDAVKNVQTLNSEMGFSGSSAVKESICNAEPGSVPESGRSAGDGIDYPLEYSWTSLVAQLVKNSPAVWETWILSLGWEDPLEKGNGYPLQYPGLENFVAAVTVISDFRAQKKKKIVTVSTFSPSVFHEVMGRTYAS